MSQESDLKKLERKTFLTYHGDGIIDILMGWLIVSTTLYLITEIQIFSFFAWFPIILYVPVKRRVTFPRFGYVNFSSQRMKPLRLFGVLTLLVLAILVSAIAILGFMINRGQIDSQIEAFIRGYGLGMLVVLIAFFFFGIARLAEMRRFYGYAGLSIVALIPIALFDLSGLLFGLILGVGILFVGFWMLFHFIRENPVLEAKDNNGVQ